LHSSTQWPVNDVEVSVPPELVPPPPNKARRGQPPRRLASKTTAPALAIVAIKHRSSNQLLIKDVIEYGIDLAP